MSRASLNWVSAGVLLILATGILSVVKADSTSRRRVALMSVSVGDTSDIITTSISSTAPAGHVVLVRGSLALEGTGSVVEFVKYDTNGTASIAKINSDLTCKVDTLYNFEQLVPSDWTWNVRCKTSGGYLTLVADEVKPGP